MRCEARNCAHNEDGYCADDSYVEITSDGSCGLYYVPASEEGDA